MTDAITFTAKRSFWGTFVRCAQLWFSGPASFAWTLVIVAIFTYVNYKPAPLWLAFLGGVAWVVIMLPLLFAFQSWKMMQAVRKMGLPVFTIDRDGVNCQSGEINTRVPWSGIDRLRLNRRNYFVYVTPRMAWFFGRMDLTSDEQQAFMDFARTANVRIQGT